jgi:hypothetical protein
MCIYCGSNNYRKIYECHFGSIPYDENGRTYDVHHIDGNRQNNALDNLIAVSIVDHYRIHEHQEDWFACAAIMVRMRCDPEDIADVAKLAAKEKVANGTHHFLGGEIQKRNSIARISNGTHNFVKEYTCPTCGKTGKGGGMLRYHFDRCKGIKPKKDKSKNLSIKAKEFHANLTEEQKQAIANKISKALKGKSKPPASENTKELRRRNMIGKKLCPLTRKWIRKEE